MLKWFLFAVLAAVLVRWYRKSRATGEPTRQLHSVLQVPERFDLSRADHVLIVDTIRERYSEVLAANDGPYAGCIFKPTAMLPFPKEDIRRALAALLAFNEGRAQSPFLDVSLRSDAAADTIRSCLVLLDDFLEVDPAILPVEPHANAQAGFALRAATSTEVRNDP